MAGRAMSTEEVRSQCLRFARLCAIPLAILILAHVLYPPRSKQAPLGGLNNVPPQVSQAAQQAKGWLSSKFGTAPSPTQPRVRDSKRHISTVVYFIAAVAFLRLGMGGRSRLLGNVLSWQYENAPAAIERLWKRYQYTLDRILGIAGLLLIVFVISTAFSTLGYWQQSFDSIRSVVRITWWASLVGLLTLPWTMKAVTGELMASRLHLDRELSIGSFKPRSLADLLRPGTAAATSADRARESAPVSAGRVPGSFVAGGREWHLESLCQNCVVFGQSGSGKTVCVLNALLDSVLAASSRMGQPAAGLILDPKGDFEGKLRVLCNTYRRPRDLLIIDPKVPDQSIRWNPLDTEDDELEVSSRFASVLETLGQKSDKDSFWIDSAKKFLRHAIKLIRLTNPPGEPPSFAEIGRLASSPSAIMERTDRLDISKADCDQCLSFFAEDWIAMAPNTRQSVVSMLTNMIDPFLMEPYQSMFSGKSTMSIGQMIDAGKILYVNMPIADKEAMARTIGTFVKLEYFRQVLQRLKKKRPSFFLCDEFQVFFTTAQGKGDADFFERNRQSNHLNIIATQNLPALLKVAEKKETVMNLLGNCMSKIFLRNTDDETNKYASELYGQQMMSVGGGGSAMMALPADRGGGSAGGNVSDHWENVVRKEEFTRLAIPSRPHQIDYCETYIHDASAPNTGETPRRNLWKIHPIG